MATVNLGNINNYINNVDAADQFGTINPDTGVTDSAESNFTQGGTLIVPMSLQDHDNDAATDPVLRPIVATSGNTVTDIRTVSENYNIALAALKELRAEAHENGQTFLVERLDVAITRGEAEAGYYAQQLAETLADTTDMRTDAQKLSFVDTDGDGIRDADELDNENYEASPITIARRHSEYMSESNDRATAEQNLRDAVATREAATANVRMQFTSPHSFYNQLIARREALKNAADKVVADAIADGDTPTMAQTEAAEDAAEALTEAQEAQSSFAALYDDENDPTVALINTLLETDGDDGQALVDALSATYNVARSAVSDAQDVVNELTGPDGQVTQNTNMLQDHEDRISANEGEIWNADGTSRIDANETRSMENRTRIIQAEDDIITNAGHIAENRTMIGENRTMVGENREMIMMQNGMIETNAMGIMDNRAMIDSNQMSIMRNMEDIQTLKSGVAASMALAGMPEMGARGVSVGAGSYGGETALAVGVHFSGENARFKIGVTSSGGETGASLGAGWSF